MTFETSDVYRTTDERHGDQLARLNALPGERARLPDLAALEALPVLRKSDLMARQGADAPFGGLHVGDASHVFRSPGPIHEPGRTTGDFWRFGRFLAAIGIGAGDLVQNTFSYHFTPAGLMFDSGAAAVGARVFPAGPGQTGAQAEAAAALGVTAYAGTPDYLQAILEAGDAAGLDLSRIRTAAVSAGPLFPAMREGYAARGITCRQCYATADAGLIAYETESIEGMVVDEGVILEIVTPGTGDRVPEGEVGEVLVTVLNPDYPLVRFATGDLSALMGGESPCGRTGPRIVGWRGRADQATKVRGMFVRPEQVATLVARLGVDRARVEVGHDGKGDTMTVRLETGGGDGAAFGDAVREVLGLRGEVVIEAPGSLPRDGVVIADMRDVG